MGDILHFKLYHFVGLLSDGHQQISEVGSPKEKVNTLDTHLGYAYVVHHWVLLILELEE